MKILNIAFIFNVFFILLVLKFLVPAFSAQILGIFPIYSKSHQSYHEIIMKNLAKRGHNVTVIGNFRSEFPIQNYTEILYHGDKMPNFIDFLTLDNNHADLYRGTLKQIPVLANIDRVGCESLLQLDYIKRLLYSKKKQIDLILVEFFHTQCYNLLANILDVPFILMQTVTTNVGADLMTGNYFSPACVPVWTSMYTNNMGFLQRLSNAAQYFILYFRHYYLFFSTVDELENYNVNPPNMNELQRRASLVFYNNHFSLINRPQTPNSIDIGGIHIKETNPLPTSLRKFIDEAEHGVIFISFGTTIKASSMPTEKLNIFQQVFSRIPQRVLWRIDNPAITNVSSNVKAAKWFPQRDILDHKNVRAFISHCGIFSTLEALYTGTPIVAIPFFYDQHQNANSLVVKGIAEYIDYNTVTEDELLSTIERIINNSMMYVAAHKLK